MTRGAGFSEEDPWQGSIDPTASRSSARSPRSSWLARPLHGLAKRHDLCRNLIRVWVAKYREAGAFDDDAGAADLIQAYEARIAALERLVGKQALELEFLKGASASAARTRNAATCVITGPAVSPSRKAARLMSLPRSTFYDKPATPADDAEIVARMRAICDEFESYGYRRVGAALRDEGIIIKNSKRVRRLMRVHDLQPRRRRRFVTTTDSAHDRAIFADLAKGMVVDAPNQLWVSTNIPTSRPASSIWPPSSMPGRAGSGVGYAIEYRWSTRA